MALTAGALVVLALVLSAAYPAPAQETSDMAMARHGRHAAVPVRAIPRPARPRVPPATPASTRAGLDLNNTPYMIMSGTQGMNMNGADASAAAGLNTTKADWSYTGPALPTATANELLAQGKNGPTEIHMAVTGCAAEPTFSQQINATQYVQATSQAVARYDDLAVALAAGYVPVSPTDYPVVYYTNPSILAANAAAKRTLDPAYIDGLIYATIPSGQEVLAAAFYVLPSTVKHPPMPYGALVQWHQRTAVCGPVVGFGDDTGHHGNASLRSGDGPGADAVHDHGVAGAGCRRSHGHSASRHPDCGGGHHADLDLTDSAGSDDVHLGQECG